MAPLQLVILLSIGSFQGYVPGVTTEPSPVFEDSAAGLAAFTGWARSTMGEPRFNQPPLRICVVGAVPFPANKGPYISPQIWGSKQPIRRLEPYAATFHYVEPAASAPVPAPRTMKQAIALCAKVHAK